MAPALNVQSFLTQTNNQAIKAIISQGVPNTRMPAWGGRLSDDELNALVSFIRSWEPTAPAVAQRPAARRGLARPGSEGSNRNHLVPRVRQGIKLCRAGLLWLYIPVCHIPGEWGKGAGVKPL